MKIKRITKKLLAWALVCVTIFSVTSCKKKEEETPTVQQKYDLDDCVHIYDVTDGEEMLVKNGKSEYTIVYPAAQASNTETTSAVSELRSLFYEATGVTLNARSDADCTKTDKILSIGQTKQAMAKTAVADGLKNNKLGSDGFIIESDGSAVYMVGNTTKASLYSAYEFLRWQFGFEFYTEGVYELQRGVTDMKLKNYHVVDIPDFQSRASSVTGVNGHTTTTKNRLRYERVSGDFAEGDYCHNHLELLPAEKYGETYKEWYSDDGSQLCLTAHGNEESLAVMIDAMANELIRKLEADPEKDWTVISQEDGGGWCTCPTCSKDIKLYDKGMQTAAWATTARFVNRVAKKVKAWNEATCPERDITIFIYEYGKVRYAPVKMDEDKNPVLDENGNYQPYSEEFMLEDNVGVFMCLLGYANGCEIGEDVAVLNNDLAEWHRAVANMKNSQIYVWTWSAPFADYFVPMQTIDTRQDYYQFMKSQGTLGVLDQGKHDSTYASDWGTLKQYICAKLMWNTQLDVQELTNNFMNAYFGQAAGVMNEMYDAYRAHMSYIRETNGTVGNSNHGNAYRTQQNFPYGVIQSFIGYIDKAYAAIEPLKRRDAEQYEQIALRLQREAVTWEYLDWKLYPAYYSTEQLDAVKNNWWLNAIEAGINRYGERKDIMLMFG